MSKNIDKKYPFLTIEIYKIALKSLGRNDMKKVLFALIIVISAMLIPKSASATATISGGGTNTTIETAVQIDLASNTDYQSGIISLVGDGYFSISDTAGLTRDVRIICEHPSAYLILNGVSIETSGNVITFVGADSRLFLNGTNTLTSTNGTGIRVEFFADLTINNLPGSTGSINATGTSSAFGIGGEICTININGGNVTANVSNNGDMVALGGWTSTININGGSVTAEASVTGGTPLVTGVGGRDCIVSITGGTINATAGDAGFATGVGGADCSVTITGGTINAAATSSTGFATGIGGADTPVSISNGTVTASAFGNTSNNFIIGIGANTNTNITGGEIYISGENYDIKTTNLLISNASAVFVQHDAGISVNTTSISTPDHIYVNSENISSNSAYGFTNFPNTWSGTAYGYLNAVTLDYNDNVDTETITVPAAETVYLGGLITEPAEPVRTGYVFDGWYTEPECTNYWDFVNDKVTGNTTLYADWVSAAEFKGDIKGTIESDSGSGLQNYSITLQSAPITDLTDADGDFAFNDVYYTAHTLIINNSSGTEVGRYTINFTAGSSTSANVNNVTSTIDVTFTSRTISIHIPFQMDAAETTAAVSGSITFGEVTATNPQTNERGMSASWWALILVSIVAMAAYLMKRKRKSYNI